MAKEFSPFGVGLFGDPLKQHAKGMLESKFLMPPFSVLDARKGDWQKRKRAWLRLGILSELGRGIDVSGGGAPGGNLLPAADYSKSHARGDGKGRSPSRRAAAISGLPAYATGRGGGVTSSRKTKADRLYEAKSITSPMHLYDGYEAKEGSVSLAGSSIFDPVICELMYRWFCPPGGQVVDPFAGGSVRGIVAALLGYRYWGSELRGIQIKANKEQRKVICPDGDIVWRRGDAYDLVPSAPRADFLFTCPPYGDLELYSDDPLDLSNMTYQEFIPRYSAIIKRSVRRLKPNRFAAIVVGNYRDRKTGVMLDFVGDTIKAFNDAGMEFYNDMILVTAIGSLPVRITKQFEAARKIGKTHQAILVFVKGDPRKATQRILAS